MSLLLVLLTGFSMAHSQQLNIRDTGSRGSSIVDDSTRSVYGPTTTRLFSQENIKFNTADYHFVDTTILDFDLEFDLFTRMRYEGQNLGNLGTAWRPHFSEAPSLTGANSGFNVFDPYYQRPEDITLYDTRSPFSWFAVQWGGEGRNVTEVKYSRNVNERWNFTLDYNSLLVDKLIGKERRGDRNVQSYNYSFNSWYRSENLKYAAYLVLSRIKHTVTEMGGVDVDPDTGELSDYFLPTAQPLLRETDNVDLRRELFMYQRYELNKLISVFHEMKWGYRKNSLRVESSTESTDYFDFEEIPYDGEAIDSTIFKYLENRAGITGYTRGFNYELYLRGRNVNFIYQHLDTESSPIVPKVFESYAGINIGTTIDSTFHIRARGEVQSNGNYLLKGSLNSNFLEGKAGVMQFDPGFIYQGYLGHYDFWVESFQPVEKRYLQGKLKLKRKTLLLEPEVYFSNTGRNLYFEKVNNLEDTQQVLPQQNAGSVNVLSTGVRTGWRGKKTYLLLSGKYNNVSGSNPKSMPIPELMANLDIGLTNTVFKNNLIFQLGLRTHWQSSYYAMGYDVAIQQFYVQDDFEVPDYWFFTAYLNGRIGRVKFFLKFNNMRKLLNPVGYFPTPEYPGINGLFDFGFKWYFYD